MGLNKVTDILSDVIKQTINRQTIEAARRGHSKTVQLLLRHSTNVNIRDLKGRTLLMWAARYCDADTVKLLLEYGAYVCRN